MTVAGAQVAAAFVAVALAAAAPPPKAEVARPDGFSATGRILELAADGPRVAALVGASPADRDHAVVWSATTHRVVRFGRPAPWPERPAVYSLGGLTLVGTRLHWLEYSDSGMDQPELIAHAADARRPGREADPRQAGTPPPRAPWRPAEIRRGVVFVLDGGTVGLARDDGTTRSIRPPGGAVDADLENAGLYYAYNLPRGPLPGRIVFVPFARLFG